MFVCFLIFFFFKQKTADDMRISDWSSDVCSSDLHHREHLVTQLPKKKQIIGLVVWLAASFIAAAIGSAASIQAGPFYTQLVRPGWAPPPDIFGPVWTVLYALMGIAAWLVWRVGGFRAARAALTLFLVQLAVNALWSWLFFGWHLGALAFADIVLLWVLIVAKIGRAHV